MKVPRGKKDLYLKALVDNDAMPSNFTSAPKHALSTGTPFDSNKTKDLAMKLAKEEQLDALQVLADNPQTITQQQVGAAREWHRVSGGASNGTT